jgi:hypothetical protein
MDLQRAIEKRAKRGREGGHTQSRCEPDGKKWIATKVVTANGKPMCWCIPVEMKYGQEIQVALTDNNAFDLASAFDRPLKAAAAPSKENKEKEDWVQIS